MKLQRLAIHRLPGIDDPFALEGLGDGVHVIVGPNGIGKSSLCRATRALLWHDTAAEGYVAASAVFERDGERWAVEREGARHRWQREGVEADPPPLPPPHLEPCFFLVLRELLDPSPSAGADVAAAIRQQMAGGFDLDAVATTLFGGVGPRHGRSEQNAFDQAEREVRQAAGDHAKIGRREDELGHLERTLGEGEAAERRLPRFETALEIDGLRSELEQVDRVLAEMPEALARMTGGEAEQLQQRERELHEKGLRRRELGSQLAADGEACEATGLQEPFDLPDLDTWRKRAEALVRLEVELDQAREELAGAEESVREASRALGERGGDSAPAIDLSGDRDLFVFLGEARAAEERRQAIEERLRLLGSRTFSEEDRRRLERLRAAVGALRAWLRVPVPRAARGSETMRRSLLGVGAGLVLLGALLGFGVHFGFLTLGGVGLGLVAAFLLLARPDPQAVALRTGAQRRFPTEVGAPPAWTEEAVDRRLEELESESGDLDAAERRAGVREVERSTLSNERMSLDERFTALDEERRELCERLGLGEGLPAAEVVDVARALDELRRARNEERGSAGRVASKQGRHRALLSELAEAVAAHGGAEPTDAAAAQAGVAHLARRDQVLRDALSSKKDAVENLARADREIAEIEKIVAEIFRVADLEPGDRAGLARRLEDLERWSALRQQRGTFSAQVDAAAARLEKAGEEALAQCDRESLEQEKGSLEEQAAALAELRGEIAEIRFEVRQAREGHDLEERLAERQTALECLHEKREEALFAAVGSFLIESIQQEHETTQMPRVLDRAKELFAGFTHHGYELRVAPDDGASFFAIDARTGRGVGLAELSDGTRAQLLLAARLAFAEEVERGAGLPLFLDEALDQSDPARFRAIARSLGRMAEDQGRQVFYLTSDPSDVARIETALELESCRAPQVIDLLEVRNRGSAVGAPEDLRVEPLPAVPRPDGHTLESYGALLGVPLLRPAQGHAAQHLFHVLWDDLSLLFQLLERRIERVGQWRMISRSGSDFSRHIAAQEDAGAQLGARADLLDMFCRSWCEGRGRRVDREALERSGALSENYLDSVSEIALELGGDGKALIDALQSRADGRLRGFRRRAADALEGFLLEEGFLDRRPVLAEEEIVARLMATPPATRLPGAVAVACAHRWWILSGGSVATSR